MLTVHFAIAPFCRRSPCVVGDHGITTGDDVEYDAPAPALAPPQTNEPRDDESQHPAPDVEHDAPVSLLAEKNETNVVGSQGPALGPTDPHTAFADSIHTRGYAVVPGSDALHLACGELTECIHHFFEANDDQQKQLVKRVPAVAGEVQSPMRQVPPRKLSASPRPCDSTLTVTRSSINTPAPLEHWIFNSTYPKWRCT